MLDELIEASGNDAVLVAYAFKHDMYRILKRYPDAVGIKTPGAIDRWNMGELKMLLAHPVSAGHGLNLQAGGHRVIWFGIPWSFELWQQFNARLYRQGQRRPVIVNRIVVRDTIEEDIIKSIDCKKTSRNAVINAISRLKSLGI